MIGAFLALAWEGGVMLGEGFGLGKRGSEIVADVIWFGSGGFFLLWVGALAGLAAGA